MHLGKWLAVLPAAKRSACVVPEVDSENVQYICLCKKKWIRQNPLWLWNPEETSPEIQKKGYQWPPKKDICLPKTLKKTILALSGVPIVESETSEGGKKYNF